MMHGEDYPKGTGRQPVSFYFERGIIMAKKKAEVATAVPEVQEAKKPAKKTSRKKKVTYLDKKWDIVGETPDGMTVLSACGEILIVNLD